MEIEQRRGIFESVKNGVVGAIRGTGDVAKAVVDTVSGTLTHTIKGTGAVGTSLIEALSDVSRAAIRGTADVGGDLGAAAKGALVGTLRGTKETSAQALDTITTTTSGVIRGTAEVAGDIGNAAKGAIQGAISGAKEVGLDATAATSAAAVGAIPVAGANGDIALSQVVKPFPFSPGDKRAVQLVTREEGQATVVELDWHPDLRNVPDVADDQARLGMHRVADAGGKVVDDNYFFARIDEASEIGATVVQE